MIYFLFIPLLFVLTIIALLCYYGPSDRYYIGYQVLSWLSPSTDDRFGYTDIKDPYIFPKMYPKLISDAERDHIMDKAVPQLQNSQLMNVGYDTSVRKSKQAWLYKTDPIIESIIQRVCDIEGVPIDRAEGLQVVKYEAGGFYLPHHDSCPIETQETREFLKKGGHRIATMIIYLNDDFTGGATTFPEIGVDIRADKCGGILFYPLDAEKKRCHPYALHGGMPVLSGEKYIATVWLREETFVT